ncbi:hypothetical protein CDD83_7711 [Cordyceps sp. RAO-2017]|nr:hypothetical protein CDD83_7711 [Cordyceps sp. RAO-2017]
MTPITPTTTTTTACHPPRQGRPLGRSAQRPAAASDSVAPRPRLPPTPVPVRRRRHDQSSAAATSAPPPSRPSSAADLLSPFGPWAEPDLTPPSPIAPLAHHAVDTCAALHAVFLHTSSLWATRFHAPSCCMHRHDTSYMYTTRVITRRDEPHVQNSVLTMYTSEATSTRAIRWDRAQQQKPPPPALPVNPHCVKCLG